MLLPLPLVAGDRSNVTGVTAPFRRVARWFIQHILARDSVSAIVFGYFSRIKKLLGRTEKRIRVRMVRQSMRTVSDISRDDQARIASCSLITMTARFRKNYSIYIIPMYLGLTPFTNPLQMSFHLSFLQFLFHSGAPPITFTALPEPELPATSSHVCITDAWPVPLKLKSWLENSTISLCCGFYSSDFKLFCI